MIDQVIAERFDHVLAEGGELLTSHVVDTYMGTGIASAPFAAWQAQSAVLLGTAFGPQHVYTESFQKATTIEGHPYPHLEQTNAGLGVLLAATEDVARGWTWTFKELVHADVFTDFLDMAGYLIDDGGYKDAAAVIAGGALEEHLRKLCQKTGIAIPIQGRRGPEPKRASAMNDELRNHGDYNQAEWRSAQAWLDLRNDAAHGNYGNYSQQQIKQMIEGIRGFVARHPA